MAPLLPTTTRLFRSHPFSSAQVVTKDMDGRDISSPIFSLTLGKCDQSSLGLTFGHPDVEDDRLDPVTFRLVAGSGPVHLIGFQMSESVTDIG